MVIFYHGGGFVVGDIGSHAALAAEIALQLDLPVVSVEYRLAPENPWPTGPDDAEAAARWVTRNDADFGRTFTGLVLCGDSAGGNLTIVTALALRDDPAALPVLMQFPLYPGTDHSRKHPSRTLFAMAMGWMRSTWTFTIFIMARTQPAGAVRHCWATRAACHRPWS